MTLPTDKPDHDSRVAAAWSAHSDELPPSRLDSTILAAARRAVDSGPQEIAPSLPAASRAGRWRIPLAAAASICAVALGFLVTRPQQPTLTPPQLTVPSAAEGALRDELQPKPAKDAPLTANQATTSVAGKRAAQQALPTDKAEERAEPARADAAPAPSAAPAQLAAAEGAASFSGRSMTKSAARAEADAAAPIDVDAAVVHIRELHEAGKLSEAAQALRVLRAAVPDADQRLPETLRDWAVTIKP